MQTTPISLLVKYKQTKFVIYVFVSIQIAKNCILKLLKQNIKDNT